MEKIYFYNKNMTIKAKNLLSLNRIYATKDEEEATILYCHFESPIFSQYKNLKYVLCPCTGIRHLKKPFMFNNRDRIVFPEIINLGDRRWLYDNIHSTSETTIWGILNLLKGEYKGDAQELHNKTIGIVGAGRVGQQLARKLYAFGCRIVLYDVQYNYYKEMPAHTKVTSLEELLNTSHVVSVHVNETDETRGLIGSKEFGQMALRPWFINTSRSSIVDPAALITAAHQKQIKGFYLDVLEDYSDQHILELYRLASHKNNIITPHKAGSGSDSREKTDLYVVHQLLNKLGGK